MWKTAKNICKEILFPQKCIKCGRQQEGYICLDCVALIEIMALRYCPFCYPAKAAPDGKSCKGHHKKLNGAYVAAKYSDTIINKAIKLLKYEPCVKEIAPALAKIILYHFQMLEQQPEDFADFIVAAVPLHLSRLKQRGFNQSEEIGKHLAAMLNLEFFPDILARGKSVKSQTGLDKWLREENVRGCFSFNPKYAASVKGKKILLVDDVITTGTTMEECAKILKQNNAQEVWGAAVAREFMNQ